MVAPIRFLLDIHLIEPALAKDKAETGLPVPELLHVAKMLRGRQEQ